MANAARFVEMELHDRRNGKSDDESSNTASDIPFNERDGSESSSEENDLDGPSILDSLFRKYNAINNDQQVLSKTSSFLENVLHSGTATCLICIESIKRSHHIWSCKHCYGLFHLNCIKRWAKDSIAHSRRQIHQQQGRNQGYYNNLGVYIPPKKVRAPKWDCPQCRHEYECDQCPQQYECFCSKATNPVQETWLVPHSCGEVCEKILQPECGHKCLLLCHPGPCPPCPQSVFCTCKCKKSPTRLVRCLNKTWTCYQKCDDILPCKIHRCDQKCHEKGECPPCNRTSKQSCVCGKEKRLCKCSELPWKCNSICGRMYDCGIHICAKICHSDPCGECPLGLPRSCPCGKTKNTVPCTEEIKSCGDTCTKLMACNIHPCTQRCHHGDCGLCLVITKKKCRCGKHEKEFPCWKFFNCESKCKQIRECGKHICNRKCCDGKCPPCEKVCGKMLACKKHKCKSVCHSGPCYPCNQMSMVICSCGTTSKWVPCGRERTARLICLEPCKAQSRCHHGNRHHCHKYNCPPCVEKCGLVNDTTGCGHKCEAQCHTGVKVLKGTLTPATNKMLKYYKSTNFECRSFPHPKCGVTVMVTCVGGHEYKSWDCWNSSPKPCSQLCDRLLLCGNHKCTRLCHPVLDVTDIKEQQGCLSCTEPCKISRPNGCVHPCQRSCHLPPCNPCNIILKRSCHCGLTQVILKCGELHPYGMSIEERDERHESQLCCGGRCIKNYACGHQCEANCHSGECPTPELCVKKVRVRCDCKTLKVTVSCDEYRAGLTSIPCNDSCLQARAAALRLQNELDEKNRLIMEEKNRHMLQCFQRDFTKKKLKQRKVPPTETAVGYKINWKLVFLYSSIILAIGFAFGIALMEKY